MVLWGSLDANTLSDPKSCRPKSVGLKLFSMSRHGLYTRMGFCTSQFQHIPTTCIFADAPKVSMPPCQLFSIRGTGSKEGRKALQVQQGLYSFKRLGKALATSQSQQLSSYPRKTHPKCHENKTITAELLKNTCTPPPPCWPSGLY